MGTLAVVGLAIVAAVVAHDPAPPSPQKAAVPATSLAGIGEPLQVALMQGHAAETDGRFPEAVRHYRKAAALGSGVAARRLGEIYLHGAPGVDRDVADAMRWNRQAELRGEVLAQAVRLRLP